MLNKKKLKVENNIELLAGQLLRLESKVNKMSKALDVLYNDQKDINDFCFKDKIDVIYNNLDNFENITNEFMDDFNFQYKDSNVNILISRAKKARKKTTILEGVEYALFGGELKYNPNNFLFNIKYNQKFLPLSSEKKQKIYSDIKEVLEAKNKIRQTINNKGK